MSPDLLRSLDVVDPPDQWDDIVARSTSAEVPALEAPATVGGSGRRRLVLAGVVVVVVAATVGALAIRGGGGGSDRAGDPSSIWGHRWQLVRLDVAGASMTTGLTGPEGAIVLDTTTRGQFRMQPCNQIQGEAEIRSGHLEVTEALTTAAGCLDPLESLLQLDGSRILISGDELVLRHPKDPEAVVTFVRTDAVTPGQQFWGNRWRVTSVSDGTSPAWKPKVGKGPHLDATDRGALTLDTCEAQRATATMAGDQLDLRGEWEITSIGYCQQGPADEVLRGVFTYPETTVTVDGKWLTVRSHGGTVKAVVDGPVRSGVEALFGHRWGVALVNDKDRPLRVPPNFVLTAGDGPTTLTVPGCATEVGGPAAIGTDGTVTVEVAPPNPIGDCIDVTGGLALSDWFRELFAEPLDVGVTGDRAIIGRPGKEVVLVRLD